MRRRYSLFTPGPVNLSEEVRQELGRPMLHHRSQEFEEVWAGLACSLREVFRTSGPVAVLSASGTAAMEAVVANLFSPGERVLVPVAGKFSHRWTEICEAYGVEVSRIDFPPGGSPSPGDIAAVLARDPSIEAVLLTQCESSTGALTDLEGIAEAIRDAERRRGRAILTISDSITSLGIDELETDLWGLDAVVAASQKGLLGPPGLSFVSLGERALRRVRETAQARYYLDLRRYLGVARPPFTPSISLVSAVRRASDLIIGLGLGNVLKANSASASALRLVFEAAGLTAVARRQAGGVVAFWADKVAADALWGTLREEHGIIIAHGQGELKGRILRVSGIGKAPREILFFAGAFASSLARLGVRLNPGDITDVLETALEDCRIWE